MFCTNCGTELPDEANFCWKCGKPQKGVAEPPMLEWEYCEIIWGEINIKFGILTARRSGFLAQVIGPKGRYEAARSDKTWNPVWTGADPLDKKQQAEVDALVKKLLNDSWEPIVEKGTEWYSYKFRRPIKG